MSINLIIITHNEIGQSILSATISTLGKLPIPTAVFSVTYETNIEKLIEEIKRHLCSNKEKESLILTDLYGSTPSNIATSLCRSRSVKAISGINLPMLIRLMNYPNLALDELVKKAATGGQDGIKLQG